MKLRLILSCAKGEAGAHCERHFEARQLGTGPSLIGLEQCRLGGGETRAEGRGAFSISELAEKRASGSVPETAVLSTLISSRLVRRPSCGGMVPIRPSMLLHAILRMSFPLHVTNAFSQHGTLASSHDRPAAFFQLCPPMAS